MEAYCKYCDTMYNCFEGNFSLRPANKSRYSCRCKKCEAKYNKEYNERNYEKLKQKRREKYKLERIKHKRIRDKIERKEVKKLKYLGTNTFSDEEIEIIFLICDEYTSKEIGEILNKSTRTIESKRRVITEKIGCLNVVGIVRFAYDNDLIEPKLI